MKKGLLIVLVLLVLVGGFAFAGGGRDSGGSGSQQQPIQFFHFMTQASKVEGLAYVQENFTRRHGVSFENFYYNSGTDYTQQLNTALASGQQPNIIMGNPGTLPHVVENGYAMELTNNAVIRSLNLSKGDLSDASYKGTLYAFPLDFKTWGVVYNVDIFNRLGLSAPTRHSEVLEVCRRLKAAGIDPWVHCFSDAVFPDISIRDGVWGGAMAIGATDMFARLMDGSRQIADYPFIAKSIETWASTIPAEWMRRDALSNDQNMAVEVFAAGGAAMFYTGTWNIGDIIDKNPNLNFDFFVMPVDEIPGNTKMTIQGDQVFMVNPKARNPELAVQFLEYWITEGAEYWSEKSAMPMNTGFVSPKLHPSVQSLAAVKASGNFIHYGDFDVPMASQFSTVWRRGLMGLVESQATNAGMTVAQVIANIQRSFDDVRATSR